MTFGILGEEEIKEKLSMPLEESGILESLIGDNLINRAAEKLSRRDKVIDLSEYMNGKGFVASMISRISKKPQKKFVFYGDTHGDWQTSVMLNAMFPADEYVRVVLGDYIDKAPLSIKRPDGTRENRDGSSLKLLFYWLNEFMREPDSNILLRGDHEFNDIYTTNIRNIQENEMPYLSEVFNLRGNHSLDKDLFEKLTGNVDRLFCSMSYAAFWHNKHEKGDGVFALHGGMPALDKFYIKDMQMLMKTLNLDGYKLVKELEGRYLLSHMMFNAPDLSGKLKSNYVVNTIRGFNDEKEAVKYSSQPFFRNMELLGLDRGALITGHNDQALVYKGEDHFEGRHQTVYCSLHDTNRSGKIRVGVLDPQTGELLFHGNISNNQYNNRKHPQKEDIL